MGEMADYYAEQAMLDYFNQDIEDLKIGEKKYSRLSTNPYKTENVLNRDTWVDGQGTIHELKDMGRDHLQNVLLFIYKRRDRYWLNCNDVTLIEKFKDGDDFFQHVIRNSVIWKAIIRELQRPTEGFNFDFTIPGK